MTTMVAGLVAFSGFLAIPIQISNAAIGTSQIADNAITSPKIKDGEVKTPDLATAAVTKEKLNPNAVKLVVIQRESDLIPIPASQGRELRVDCNSNEVATGGGFRSGEGVNVFVNTGSGNGWAVVAFNPGEFGDQRISAVVKCSHLELGP